MLWLPFIKAISQSRPSTWLLNVVKWLQHMPKSIMWNGSLFYFHSLMPFRIKLNINEENNKKCWIKPNSKTTREADAMLKAKFCITSFLSFTVIHQKGVLGTYILLSYWQICSNLQPNNSEIISVFTAMHALFLVYASNCDVSWDRNRGSVTVFGREKGGEKACRAFILFSSSRSCGKQTAEWKADCRVQREWGHRSLREHVLKLEN